LLVGLHAPQAPVVLVHLLLVVTIVTYPPHHYYRQRHYFSLPYSLTGGNSPKSQIPKNGRKRLTLLISDKKNLFLSGTYGTGRAGQWLWARQSTEIVLAQPGREATHGLLNNKHEAAPIKTALLDQPATLFFLPNLYTEHSGTF
jgi:hypothetical protein